VATTPSEQRPLVLLLPSPAAVADALRAVVADARVRAFALPAVWDLAWGPLDALSALPDVRRLDLDNLPKVVAWLQRVATKETLEGLVAAQWRSLPDRVREFWLRRSALAVVASLFRVGRPSGAFDPPESFRLDRVLAMRLEASYRLARDPDAPWDREAPPEEASVVWYPFDPAGALARADLGAEAAGHGAALEVFAYEAGRARHRSHLAQVAARHGWRVAEAAPA
jgi:hypothetical protein